MQNALEYITARLVWSGVAVLVVVGGGAWLLFGSHGAKPQTITVTRGDFIDTVEISGKVVAAKDVDLGWAQSGRVSGVYAKVGQQVYAGAVLAEIENGDLRAVLEQKQASLEAAQADLAATQAGTRPEEVAVTQAQVDQDQSALNDAIQSAYSTADDAVHNQVDQFVNDPRTDHPTLAFDTSDQSVANTFATERVVVEAKLTAWNTALLGGSYDLAAARGALNDVAQLLADASAVLNRGIPTASLTQSTLNGYSSDVSAARTAVLSALTSVNAAATKLATDQKSLALKQAPATQSDLDAAQAKVRAAQAEVTNARAALAKTMVLAPFSGIITRMDAKVGSVASPSVSDISMISGTYQVEVYVPEVNIGKIKVGQAAEITLDAYGSGEPLAATVASIDPAETLQGGISTYKTTLQFAKDDSRIRSGLTANVTITVQDKPDTIAVPASAVVIQDTQTYVMVLRGSTQVLVPVTEGLSTLGTIEITSGLSAGDVVVLDPSS